MKKINGGFFSLTDLLILSVGLLYKENRNHIKDNADFLKLIKTKKIRNRIISPYLNQESEHYTPHFNESPKSVNLDYLIGVFQPFASMVNDAQKLSKPYKSSYEFEKDLLQAIKGLKNIWYCMENLIFICLFICIVPFVLIYDLGRFLLIDQSLIKLVTKLFNIFFITTILSIDCLAHLIRGVTQILATPLTWLIKIPIRKLLTNENGGYIEFCENEDIQRLVSKGEEAIKVCQDDNVGEHEKMSSACFVFNLCQRLHELFEKGISHQENIATNVEIEGKTYELIEGFKKVKLLDIDGKLILNDHKFISEFPVHTTITGYFTLFKPTKPGMSKFESTVHHWFTK